MRRLKEEIESRRAVLDYPRARKLHIADPSGEQQALCGKEGDATMRGYLDEHLASEICRGCVDAEAKLVRVSRPDPLTGEVLEEVLPAAHFKPPPSEIITRAFRERVMAGQYPGLVFPGAEDCPVEVGEEIELTSNVSIMVIRLKKTKGGDHRALYRVSDFRPALMRRTPKMHEPPETDEHGHPIPHTRAAIDAARVDGNYTQDAGQSVPDSAPEVGVEYQRVLGVRKRAKQAERKREENPKADALEAAKALSTETRELAKRLARSGVDPTLALVPVAQAIAKAHADISAGKAPTSAGVV